MKKQILLPLTAGVGGMAAFALRLWQMQTGFEPDTGLPVPGHPAGIALVVLLAVTAAVLVLLARTLPADRENAPSFPADFSTENAGLLMLPIAGVFLVAISGALDVLLGIGILESTSVQLPGIGIVFLFVSSPFSSTIHLVMGVLSLASAAALFIAVAVCRRKGTREHTTVGNTWVLLLPTLMLVVRLVLTYRVDSVNPSLAAYYVELLALVLLTLGFYRLSSFAFGAGRSRSFAAYSGGAVVLSLAALADSDALLTARLLYLGGAAVLLGCLTLLLATPSAPAGPEGTDV